MAYSLSALVNDCREALEDDDTRNGRERVRDQTNLRYQLPNPKQSRIKSAQ